MRAWSGGDHVGSTRPWPGALKRASDLIRTHGELLAHAVEKLQSDPTRTPHGTLAQNVIWANADHFTLTTAS